jgi:DNA-binding MarR family transcriptional regulator
MADDKVDDYKDDDARLTKEDFEAQDEFRYALRLFLGHSERVAREAGVTPQQYQALLSVKGYRGGDSIRITEMAERLQLKHHSVVELIDRMQAQGLVARVADSHDRRQVLVALTDKGERYVQLVAGRNRAKLRELQTQIYDFIQRLQHD